MKSSGYLFMAVLFNIKKEILVTDMPNVDSFILYIEIQTDALLPKQTKISKTLLNVSFKVFVCVSIEIMSLKEHL